MIRKMQLTIKPTGGSEYERLLTYEGETPEDIARAIERDENQLMHYMLTGDDEGQKAFVFQGLMLKKSSIEAAQFSEPEYL